MFLTKLVIPLVAVAVLLVTACGGSAGGNAASVAAPVRAGAPAQAGALPAAQAPASGSKPAAAGSAPAAVSPATPDGQMLQLNADMTLQVPNGRFEQALNDLIGIATGAGGYISGQNAQAVDQSQPLRSGQVTFEVPASKLTGVMRDISREGREHSVHISGTNVTLQYVDLQARLVNAEAQRDAMLTLMSQARSVNDIIQVQNQLGTITGQIEQLKGQIAYLDHTTSYATLAVTIQEDAAAATQDQWGIQTAASQALHNFVGVVAFLILAIGTLAPLLIALALAAVGGRFAWRRLRAE